MGKPVNDSQKRIVAPSTQPVLLANLPKHPPDLVKRFPSVASYDEALKKWIRLANSQLG